MPKLRQTPTQQYDSIFKAVLAKQSILLRIDTPRICRRLGVCENTWYNRTANPGSMRLKELRALCEYLRISDRELCQICGVKYEGQS